MQFIYQIIFQKDLYIFLSISLLILILIVLSNILISSINIYQERIRKLMHFIIGVLCSISPYFFQSRHYPLILAIIFIIINILGKSNKIILLNINLIDRTSYGTLYFSIAYFIHVLCFWNYKEYFLLSFLILSICDPIAAIVGKANKNNKSFTIWRDNKTIAGTLAFFSSTFILLLGSGYTILNISLINLIFFSIFISIGTTIAEITSNRGTDNITIPLASILLMFCFDNHNSIIYKFKDILIFDHSLLYLIVLIIFSFIFSILSLRLIISFGFFI